MRRWVIAMSYVLTQGAVSMNADAGPSLLEQMKERAHRGPKAGRASAIRELARLGPNPISSEFEARLDELPLGDHEATAILELWRDRPFGATATRAARWVSKVLGDAAPAPTPLPRLAARTENEKALAVAAVVIARRSDDLDAQRALALLAAYPDERVARPAATALVDAKGLDAKVVLPQAIAMLGTGDPELEDRALTLLVRSKDERATLAIIEAAERTAEGHGEAPEHVAALRKLTGQKLGDDPAAWRQWWNKRAR